MSSTRLPTYHPQPNAQQRTYLTTGQAARIVGCAPRTITQWIDTGQIPGSYRLAGAKDRRIPREALIRFLRAHNMPLGELLGQRRVLLLGMDRGAASRLTELLASEEYHCEYAAGSFEAGVQSERLHPDTVVVDLSLGQSESLAIGRHLRASGVQLLLALGYDDTDAGQVSEVCDELYRQPFDVQLLAARIERGVEVPRVESGKGKGLRRGKARQPADMLASAD